MKGPTAWLITRKDGQDEKIFNLNFLLLISISIRLLRCTLAPTPMQSTGLEAVECRFDIDNLVGNLVLWADLTVQKKKFLVNPK